METTSDYRTGSPFGPEPLASDQDNREPAQRAGSEVVRGTVLAPREVRGPLAADPDMIEPLDAIEPEALGDGVWGQTALSAAYASAVLLAFAILCWITFPAGGVAVTVLGALVSLMGLSSRRVTLSAVMLTLHGLLFFACYLRAI